MHNVMTTHSTAVAVPADAVFAYLSHVANEAQWRQSIVGSRYVDAEKPRLGVHGETDVSMGSRSLTMRWEIIEFTPGRHVRWQLDGDPWHGGGRYTVRPEGAGAIIEAGLEVRLRGAARVFEPLIGLQLRRGLRADMGRLAALLPTVA